MLQCKTMMCLHVSTVDEALGLQAASEERTYKFDFAFMSSGFCIKQCIYANF